MKRPPIQSGEIFIHCPECKLLGWTADDPDRLLPICPTCGTRAMAGPGVDTTPDIRIVDGEPTDTPHHLSLGDFA